MASYWGELETCKRVQIWFVAEGGFVADRLKPLDFDNKLKRTVLGEYEAKNGVELQRISEKKW